MKIRYITIIFTVFLLGTFLINEKYIRENNYEVVDVVELNKVYKEIESRIIKGEELLVLEKQYNCSIVPIEDKEYKGKVYKAIEKGRIIIDYYNDETIVGKIIFKGKSDNYSDLVKKVKYNQGLMVVMILLSGYGFIYFLYITLVKPFKKLQGFATNITKGQLEIPLAIDKQNYFGAFTESFDLMREDLKKAREGEYKANLSKKELVASLSHDIKTPVATIKAICEVLMLKIKDNEILKKIKIVDDKATMIDNLINNMFHATLDELQVLKIEKKEEFSTILMAMFQEINNIHKIIIKNEIPSCLIYADKLRLNQVIDNIINNSYKYGDTDIEVAFEDDNDRIYITISDNGPGVSSDELPLLTEKYYRGNNAGGKSGSGLGLFLSKVFMEGMDGTLKCYSEDGFIVMLSLKKV